MSASWHPLDPSARSPLLPPLLLSAIFTASSYTVHLTDLAFIWSESLDRRAIIRRSLDEDTSIDPSEDAEQLRLFLQKIQLGLDGGEGTSLALARSPSGLDLRVTATLPKGLRPLQWPVRLRRSSPSVLRAQLVVPLLRAQNTRARELEELVEMLREKDHVVQKLMDKLETTGAELGQIFAGATGKGRRELPRKAAEERVKGLAAFDVAAWRKKMKDKEAEVDGDEVAAVVKDAFGSEYGSTLKGMTDSALPESWDEWWDNLDGSIQLSDGKGGKKAALDNTSPTTRKNKEPAALEDDYADFQVQATPPHRTRSPTAVTDNEKPLQGPTVQPVIDDTTDSDDLDVPSQRSAVPDSYPLYQPKPQPRKLGAISGPKISQKPQPPPAATRKPETTLPMPKVEHRAVDDEETASEDEDESSPPPKPVTPSRHTESPVASVSDTLSRTASPPMPSRPQIKIGMLGKIGGRKSKEERKREEEGDKNERSRMTPAEPPLPEQKAKPKARLGVIGHSKAAPPSSSSSTMKPTNAAGGTEGGARGRRTENRIKAEGREGGRATETTSADAEKRETSRERADRKRADLKLELAEKAKAPAKKKRKF